MRLLLFSITTLFFTSCANKDYDERFCECLAVGEKLNIEGGEILDKNSVSNSEVDKAVSLRNKKDSICEPYTTMGGEEMLKRKAACEKSK